MNALKTGEELKSFARANGIEISKNMKKAGIKSVLLNKNLIELRGGVIYSKFASPAVATKVSAALQPPSRLRVKLALRQQLPHDYYEHFVKNNMRSALSELKEKRRSMFPNYDAKTYVSKSEPLYLYYKRNGYTRVRVESDYDCNSSFCLGECSRCRDEIKPKYYWVKGGHRVFENDTFY